MDQSTKIDDVDLQLIRSCRSECNGMGTEISNKVVIRKNYTSQNAEKSDGAPQQKASANLNLQDQPDIGTPQINPKSKISTRRYASKTNAMLPAVKTPPLTVRR